MIVFDWDGDEDIVDIDNARIPQAVRMHGARFRNPARFVADLGNDEYVLFAEDGELLDLVYLRCGTPHGCPLGAIRRKRSGSFREAIADNTLHGNPLGGFGEHYRSPRPEPEAWPRGIHLLWPTRGDDNGMVVTLRFDTDTNRVISLYPHVHHGAQTSLRLDLATTIKERQP